MRPTEQMIEAQLQIQTEGWIKYKKKNKNKCKYKILSCNEGCNKITNSNKIIRNSNAGFNTNRNTKTEGDANVR